MKTKTVVDGGAANTYVRACGSAKLLRLAAILAAVDYDPTVREVDQAKEQDYLLDPHRNRHLLQEDRDAGR